jgi:hypothetical protein
VCTFNPVDGDSMFLRNVGNYLQVHTALPSGPTPTNNMTLNIVLFEDSVIY